MGLNPSSAPGAAPHSAPTKASRPMRFAAASGAPAGGNHTSANCETTRATFFVFRFSFGANAFGANALAPCGAL